MLLRFCKDAGDAFQGEVQGDCGYGSDVLTLLGNMWFECGQTEDKSTGQSIDD
jgi:hypothetical protein